MIGSRVATVYDAVAAVAKAHPDRPMYNTLPSQSEITGVVAGTQSYAMFIAFSNALAGSLSRQGYGSGMRVGLLLATPPMFFAYLLALNKLGASVVPINPDLRAEELQYLIGHSEPALIVATAERVADLQAAADVVSCELTVISPAEDPPAPRANARVCEDVPGRQREAAILYTSGTTGRPKGCVLSNGYFLLCGEWYAGAGGLMALANEGERMITPLPLFHMNAMACSFMAMVYVGGCLTVLDRFHPKTWWADVAASRATCLHYLGVMPSILMQLPEAPGDRAHTVRFGFGAGVDPKLHGAFEARFGFPLVEAWAMTETGNGAVIAATDPDDRLVGQSCLGTAKGWVATKILPEGDDPEQGELLVRNAGNNRRRGFFSHYYKDPEATAEAWKGGWFHTGDIVRRDTAGRFFFVDRKKNVIRRSGENIAAVEVESVLMRHPAIMAAGVAPVPDTVRGDEVFAMLKVAEPVPAEAIVTWALSQMAYYKVPGYIAFVDGLPLTATQKIQRKALKEMALALLDHPETATLTHLKKRQVA